MLPTFLQKAKRNSSKIGAGRNSPPFPQVKKEDSPSSLDLLDPVLANLLSSNEELEPECIAHFP